MQGQEIASDAAARNDALPRYSPLLWKNRPRWRDLATDVAESRGLTVKELLARSRTHRVSHARHELMFAMAACGFGLSETGRLLGGFDHTTVLHGIRAHAKRIAR